MKNVKQIRFIILLGILTMLVTVACNKKETIPTKDEVIEENITTTPPPEIKESEPPVVEVTKEPKKENHENDAKSKLTGLWVKKTVANKRPYAIMFNNIRLASPQSGISDADILYEALVEGGITRLMGIFENIKTKRIGSVRSARHYFVSFADEYDAIFVHFGETKYATKKIASLGINNLSGLTGIGSTVFYRDKSIHAPHNAFASAKGIIKGTGLKKYDTEYEKDYKGHFKFYEEDTKSKSDIIAKRVTLKFSNYTAPYFTYDSEDKVYKRFQFGGPHKDFNTKNQLTFKNLIIQYVKEWNIDKNGYQTMEIENASGEGYYVTNGKAVEITWKKNESTKKMRYYSLNGKELVINPGKTYIGVFPSDRKSEVVFSKNK